MNKTIATKSAEWWTLGITEIIDSQNLSSKEKDTYKKRLISLKNRLIHYISHSISINPAMNITSKSNILAKIAFEENIPQMFIPKNLEMVIRINDIYVYSPNEGIYIIS